MKSHEYTNQKCTSKKKSNEIKQKHPLHTDWCSRPRAPCPACTRRRWWASRGSPRRTCWDSWSWRPISTRSQTWSPPWASSRRWGPAWSSPSSWILIERERKVFGFRNLNSVCAALSQHLWLKAVSMVSELGVYLVMVYLVSILLTQPCETFSCLEMSQGRVPFWARSTMSLRTSSGSGRPLMNDLIDQLIEAVLDVEALVWSIDFVNITENWFIFFRKKYQFEVSKKPISKGLKKTMKPWGLDIFQTYRF